MLPHPHITPKYLLDTLSLIIGKKLQAFSILKFWFCLKLLIKTEQTIFSLRFNSLSNNLYEEVENNQKWTRNQFIKFEKEQLSHINLSLNLLQEKLVRSSVSHAAEC